MLIKYGAYNFTCFKEGINISMETKDIDESVEIDNNLYLTKLLCVKGGNGSGKTNILKAISFIAFFCAHSFKQLETDDEIPVESFFDSKEPSKFYIEFHINNIHYRYELVLTRNEVLSEKLYRIVRRKTLIIERKLNKFSYLINEFELLKMIKLRSNTSLISTANQYDFKEVKELFKFFDNISSNVANSGLRINPKFDFIRASEFYKSNPKMFQFAKQIIRKCTPGIVDIKLIKRTDENNKIINLPFFVHELSNSKKKMLRYLRESSGTRRLYLDLIRYFIALKSHSILILDEFDINYHPHILPILLDLFDNSQSNPFDSQLLFTTHNTEILNTMGKYRSILVNNEDNESYAYRIDQLPGDLVRSNGNIAKRYNEGKLGGVPNIWVHIRTEN